MRLIKASECIWAICNPTNEDDYFSDKAKKTAGLTRRFRWSVYESQFIKPYLKVSNNIIKEGVEIITNLTFDDFNKLLGEPKIEDKVIILFAHHENEYVEFYDRLYSIDEITSIIPNKGSFIVDFCVCTSRDIGEKMRRVENDRILSRFMNDDAIPSFWMYFYWDLFKSLNTENLNYLEAFVKTTKKFLS